MVMVMVFLTSHLKSDCRALHAYFSEFSSSFPLQILVVAVLVVLMMCTYMFLIVISYIMVLMSIIRLRCRNDIYHGVNR
jgi:hypothetical protein